MVGGAPGNGGTGGSGVPGALRASMNGTGVPGDIPEGVAGTADGAAGAGAVGDGSTLDRGR